MSARSAGSRLIWIMPRALRAGQTGVMPIASLAAEHAAASGTAAFALEPDDAHRERVGQALLRLSGLRCAGCAASVERALRSVDGFSDATINVASQQARVHWDPQRTELPALLDAIRHAGYGATPDAAATARELRSTEKRSALWRAFVAGFCAMQVMMFAAPGYVADAGDIAPDLK
ncbi:MAG: heavy metal-associated domain-containing protein, partial [Burkholderiaceae bacterium]